MRNPLKNKKVLVTSGPTWVRIDDVRVIANVSSGAMGQLIALELLRNAARVTLLQGPVQVATIKASLRTKNFTFYEELRALFDEELKKHFDVVIHAAAVADYRPVKSVAGKIRSDKKNLTLTLTRTRKLIDLIRARQPNAILVGFKLEPTLKRAGAFAVAKPLFDDADCDLAVVNSRTASAYSGFIVNKDGKVLAAGNSRERIAKELIRAVKEKL